MTEVYTVMGFALPKPERAAELKELLLSFVEPSRAEDGCLEYHVHVDREDGTTFAFYEVWRSEADLDRHLAQPYLQEFWERRMDYLEQDLDVRRVRMLSPYPPAVASA